MILFISAGDGEDAGFDQLLKALMGFVHDKQTALDNGPLLVDLNIRGGKALAGYLLGLAYYLLSLFSTPARISSERASRFFIFST